MINQLQHSLKSKPNPEEDPVNVCPTLYDLVDCSPPGSSIHGILQTRILEWVAINLMTLILNFKKSSVDLSSSSYRQWLILLL